MMEIKDNGQPQAEPIVPAAAAPKPRAVFSKADYLAIFTVLAAAWSYVWGSYKFGELFWVFFAVIYMGANFLYIRMQKQTIAKESYLYAGFVLAGGVALLLCSLKGRMDEIAAGFYSAVRWWYAVCICCFLS